MSALVHIGKDISPSHNDGEIPFIENLPPEVMTNILCFLDKNSLHQCYKISPLCRNILNHPYIWRLRGITPQMSNIPHPQFDLFNQNLMLFDGIWHLPDTYNQLVHTSCGRDVTNIINRQIFSGKWVSCISSTYITPDLPCHYCEIEIISTGINTINFSFGVTSHLPVIHHNCPCSYQCYGFHSKELNLPYEERLKYQLVNPLKNDKYRAMSFLGNGQMLFEGNEMAQTNNRWKKGDRISLFIDYTWKIIKFYYNYIHIYSFCIESHPYYLYLSLTLNTSARLVSPSEAYQSIHKIFNAKEV